MKGGADAVEEVGVDAAAREDVVDVAAVAMYLAAQPGDATLLAAQLLLDYLSDEYRFVIIYFLAVACHINCIFLRVGLWHAR